MGGNKVVYDWHLYSVLGQNLKRLRTALGMSSTEFAAHVRLPSRQSYSYIERGKVRLSVEDLYRILKTFGIPLEFLFRGYEFPEIREFKAARAEREAQGEEAAEEEVDGPES